MSGIFVSDFTFYQPPLDNPSELPKLAFCDPLFKRRLSQISRMTIQVVHDVIQKNPNARQSKLVFASFRGELSRQLKINKSLYEDADIMPASFSISVFNTPPAAATIAEKIKAGYTAVYPSEDDFHSALLAAAAPVLCGAEKEILFVYADEYIIYEYKSAYKAHGKKEGVPPFPLAFACCISCGGDGKMIDLSEKIKTPQEFARAFVDEVQD